MTDTLSADGIEVALRKGFHTMVGNDMARQCRAHARRATDV